MDDFNDTLRRRLVERRLKLVKHGGSFDALRDTDAALGRLDAGTYGQCMGCGGAIGRSRLQAVPETPWCVGCEDTENRRPPKAPRDE